MSLRPQRPVQILLVEDNPADVDIIAEVFAESKVPNRVNAVKDGVEALAYLRKTDERFKDALPPDLVLLDLNLPRKDGREVLADVKADPKLLHIPIVVLTSSHAARDELEAYRLHANCYVTKPGTLDEFLSTLKAIDHFWLGLARLP